MQLLKTLSMIGNALSGASQQAANMDGGVFWRAAEGAGLPTDIQTLNELVDLVNHGYTPEAAASAVKSKRGGLIQQQKPSNKTTSGLLGSQGGFFAQTGQIAKAPTFGLLQPQQVSPDTTGLLSPLLRGQSGGEIQ